MNITVYLGSRLGNDSSYSHYAYALGAHIASHGHTLVYGGSKTGLMGLLADGALDHEGRVIGVEPAFFVQREVQHPRLTELIITEDMSERKKKMMELGHVFLAFPGGIGTLEELSEVLCHIKLGLLQGTFAFLDFNGFYQPLKAYVEHMAKEGFIEEEWVEGIPFIETMEALDRFLDSIGAENRTCMM